MEVQFDHPIFSGTEDEFWNDITLAPECSDPEVGSFITENKSAIIEKAIEVLEEFLKSEIIGDSPIEPDEFLFRLFENQHRGFITYLNFILPSSKDHDSDSWWVMVACPNPFAGLPKHALFNVWRLGWDCQ
ncbi:MAG: hypothetical protein AB7S75_20955 [Desulfococcaceae bacterium]